MVIAIRDALNQSSLYEVKAQDNLDAQVDPTVNDDATLGYSKKSTWINQDTKEVFRCIDSTVGAAVWVKTSLTFDELGSAAVEDVGVADGVASLDASVKHPLEEMRDEVFTYLGTYDIAGGIPSATPKKSVYLLTGIGSLTLTNGPATEGSLIFYTGIEWLLLSDPGAVRKLIAANNGDAFTTAPSATGANSVALGNAAQANSNNGIAIGNGAVAQENGITIGYPNAGRVSAGATGTIAIGNAEIHGPDSIVIGVSSSGYSRNNPYQIRIGTDAVGGREGVAIGKGANADLSGNTAGIGNVAIGSGATTSNSGHGVAIGAGAYARTSSVAIGSGASTNGAGNNTEQIAIGRQAGSSGERTVAIGFQAKCTSQHSVAIGSQAFANSPSAAGYNIAIGYQATISNNVTTNALDRARGIVAIGSQATAQSKPGAIVLGRQARPKLANALNIGSPAPADSSTDLQNNINGDQSIAIGARYAKTEDATPQQIDLLGTHVDGTNNYYCAFKIKAFGRRGVTTDDWVYQEVLVVRRGELGGYFYRLHFEELVRTNSVDYDPSTVPGIVPDAGTGVEFIGHASQTIYWSFILELQQPIPF